MIQYLVWIDQSGNYSIADLSTIISSNGFFDRMTDVCFLEILNCFLRNRLLFYKSNFALIDDFSSE